MLLPTLLLGIGLHVNSPYTDTAIIKQQHACIVESSLVDALIVQGKSYLGTPYKYAGYSSKGFDCSGLVSYIFGTLGGDLTRSSSGLSRLGEEVDFDQVQKGDLVFFTGRNKNSKSVGHVAFVIGGKGDHMLMLHATSRGVVIDNLSEISYYQERFLFAKRLDYSTLFNL